MQTQHVMAAVQMQGDLNLAAAGNVGPVTTSSAAVAEK
jgi:hypothetical protein